MKHKIDYILQIIQLYSYKLPTCKIGNAIMEFRLKYTLNKRCGRVEYTNVKTKHYDSMLIEEFNTYYEEKEKDK